ncbi:MAG: glucose-6-phosphate 1-dehydrogenase [Candidatus Parcubacteria bacterium]|jgi:glucose-6-phosphate 1-dehydrogenase|nr:glucose-6-phosphate 1-dehydrogenase [Candidatus Parcubacteria bacterium]
MEPNPSIETALSSQPLALHPTVFVIFGITGDLASRKLLPALLALYSKNLLPSRFAIIGFSRRSFSREEFREYIRERLNVRPGQFKEEVVKHFFDHMSYEQGFFDTMPAYERLASRLQAIDEQWGQCSNKLFHLSVPPKLYEGILRHLADSKLTIPCDDQTGWTRVLIEKPFGNDIVMAHSLDKLLGKLFDEKQIFRIDHYLAKEALQNILAFRFENPIFEPMWRREYIDKVHIKLFEKNGIEGREAFYDQIGALRDVGQNHMLVMLALMAMNMPKSFSVDDIRRERAKILSSLQKISPQDLRGAAVKGQYAGYTAEQGIKQDSKTETYFRIKAALATPRWKGVPFFLESGKALSESKAEIDIYFKNDKKRLAGGADGRDRKTAKKSPADQNILTFRIQPDECIKIKFFVKTPGYGFKIEPKTLKFKYSDVPAFSDIPDDYERLIHDAFVGDQTLFASTSEIMASWKFVTPILENWGRLPLKIYERGAREID